jgi:hypothetical protein
LRKHVLGHSSPPFFGWSSNFLSAVSHLLIVSRPMIVVPAPRTQIFVSHALHDGGFNSGGGVGSSDVPHVAQ